MKFLKKKKNLITASNHFFNCKHVKHSNKSFWHSHDASSSVLTAATVTSSGNTKQQQLALHMTFKPADQSVSPMNASWCPADCPPQHIPSPPLTNQSSQHKRGQLLENDGVARLVSFKDLFRRRRQRRRSQSDNVARSVCEQLPCGPFLYFVRQQLLHGVRRHAGRLQLLARLGGSFPFHQRFGLSQEVRHQDLKDRHSRAAKEASATTPSGL